MSEPVAGVHEFNALPGVKLVGVQVRRCTNEECGARQVSIPAMGELEEVLVQELVKLQRGLTPGEFRFLRKVPGWSKEDAAEELAVDAENVARWESGEVAIPPDVDERLRRLVGPAEPVDEHPEPVEGRHHRQAVLYT